MGKDLAAAFPAAREAWERADAALGAALSSLAFEGPAEQLTETRNAQPALLTHAAAVWAVVSERAAPHVRAAAGHSLGELSALHVSGALALDHAVRLVRRRGELMHAASVQRPGTMAAVLGELRRPIDDVCREATEATGTVVAANYNTAEQIVISGETAAVERAMTLAKDAGARRAVRLNVAGAFHSPLMEPAQQGFADALNNASWTDPAWPIYSNVTAEPVRTAARARELLIRQLTSPVRWSDVVRAMASAHPAALFVEIGPGNVLTGLLKRLAPSREGLACGTVAEVEALLSRLQT